MNISKIDLMEYSQKITLDDSKFNSGMTNAKGGLSTLGSVGSSVFSGITKSVTIAGGAMAGLIGYGVKYNSQMEQYKTSFSTMLGSAEEAEKLTETLKAMGASTPFEMSDLANATQTLMSFGFEADDATGTLKMLGDISQGSSEKLGSISRAFGKMSSSCKVGLEDINIMIDAGFNPLQEISDSTGESMGSLYDRISKGTMSVDEITASMERSTSAGGKYSGSMEAMSKTVSGQISTLQDNFSSFAGVIAGDATSAISQDFLPMLNQMLGDMQKGFTEGGISGLADVVGKSLSDITLKVVEYLPSMIDSGISIINSLITGLQANLPQISTAAISIVSTLLSSMFDMLPNLLQMGLDLIVQLVSGIAQALPTLIPQAVDCILTLVNTLVDNLPMLIDTALQLILALSDGLIAALPNLIEQAPVIIQKLVDGLTDAMPKIIDAAISIIMALAQALVENLPALAKAAITIIAALVGGLINALGQLYTIPPKLFAKLVEFFNNTDWGELGKNIMSGIGKGLVSGVSGIWGNIKDAGGAVISSFKSLFGIHSPSTVFRDMIGKNLALGLGEGFTDGMTDVADEMTKAVPTSFTTKGLVSYGEPLVNTAQSSGGSYYSNSNSSNATYNTPVNITSGDIIINGNTDEKTISEIRRQRRDDMNYLLKEFKKLQAT